MPYKPCNGKRYGEHPVRLLRPNTFVRSRLVAPFRVRYGFLSRGADRSRYGWEPSVHKGPLLERGGVVKSPDLLDSSNSLHHLFSEKREWRIRGGIFDFSHAALYLRGVGVAESTSWPAYQRMRRKPIGLGMARRIRARGPAAVASQHRWNYYHWLIEDLPPLVYLRQAVPNLTVYVEKTAPSFVRQTLAFYGVNYELSWGLRKFSEIVFIGRGDDSGWARSWDIQQIRGNKEPRTRSRRIYISRRNSSRTAAHEPALECWLSTLGFEVVLLEELPFARQVELLSEAAVVVAPHGSGLANLVFAPTGTHVIEIFERRNVNQCFQRLSAVCGHHHEGIIFDQHEEAGLVLPRVREALEALEALEVDGVEHTNSAR